MTNEKTLNKLFFNVKLSIFLLLASALILMPHTSVPSVETFPALFTTELLHG